MHTNYQTMEPPPPPIHSLPAPAASSAVAPRIVIHGGAGAILKSRIPPARQCLYRDSLLAILRHASDLLAQGESALVAAAAAVARFEENPLYNCGRGAVFTRTGTIELEASVMVSRGFKKHAAAVSLVRSVKHPILLARKILEHGEQDMEGAPPAGPEAESGEEDGHPAGGVSSEASAGGHCHLSGPEVERLARVWGLEMVDERYFWTRKRWEEHRRGLQQGQSITKNEDSVPTWARITACAEGELHALLASEDEAAGWDGIEYLPQGTVGAVALDASGMLCVATSTGGLTNKLPGRIGDTPTIGAGFWAEEWERGAPKETASSPLALPMSALPTLLRRTCMPWLQASRAPDEPALLEEKESSRADSTALQAVALSGTGNGDSFLRLSAARWTAAIPRLDFKSSLATAVTRVLGPGGELQRSAGDRWQRTGEGQGGAIGIEVRKGKGAIVADYNCGGMFRAWIDDEGKERARIWREDLE